MQFHVCSRNLFSLSYLPPLLCYQEAHARRCYHHSAAACWLKADAAKPAAAAQAQHHAAAPASRITAANRNCLILGNILSPLCQRPSPPTQQACHPAFPAHKCADGRAAHGGSPGEQGAHGDSARQCEGVRTRTQDFLVHELLELWSALSRHLSLLLLTRLCAKC